MKIEIRLVLDLVPIHNKRLQLRHSVDTIDRAFLTVRLPPFVSNLWETHEIDKRPSCF